ncbi:MAG: HPr family phosphocarrier protein [Lachnospiraceae bacterium]|nr:HPr family phosphocarrier protein [Lachnospiraceae bacterium]
MTEFTYTITDPQGVHARPAGIFVKEAASFPCNITIGKDGKDVDAKRILGVMSLGVKQGEEVVVKCDGDQEAEAAEKLEAFLKENL